MRSSGHGLKQTGTEQCRGTLNRTPTCLAMHPAEHPIPPAPQYSNISLDLSAASTGCRGAQCAINLRVSTPLPGTCADRPGPYPTV